MTTSWLVVGIEAVVITAVILIVAYLFGQYQKTRR